MIVPALPCPFCGKPADVRYSDSAGKWDVGCVNGACPAEVSVMAYPRHTAVQLWNHRPDAPLSLALQAKLASIAAHVEEMILPGGHTFDVVTARQLVQDAAVVEWLDGMRKLALVPVRRA